MGKEFKSFKSDVEQILNDKYGINPDDCTDDDVMRNAWDNGETAEEFVEWVSDKYDLTDINDTGW